jgi:hypothetical protein
VVALAHGGPGVGERVASMRRGGVGVDRAGEHGATGPVSMMRPKYMTPTRSATLRTTARSWLIIRTGHAALALDAREQRQDLRAHADVERGHRLVGDHELGLGRERAGDADALALTARELVRQPVQERRGGR